MEEKEMKKTENPHEEKLVWEVPKLIDLDKSKTDTGYFSGTVENSTYTNPESS